MKLKKFQFSYVPLSFAILRIIFLAPIASAVCPADCGHDGKCDLTTSTCTCKLPWTGSTCNDRDACAFVDVDNEGEFALRNCHHGKCVSINGPTNQWKCDCEKDYLGEDCSIPDPCKFNEKGVRWKEGSACFGGEECTSLLHTHPPSFSCKCPPRKLHPRCRWDDPCDPINKKNKTNHPCYADWREKECIPELESEDKQPKHTCKCKRRYFGDRCENRYPCLFPNKCEDSDSICVRVSNYDYNCTCKRPQNIGKFCTEWDLCKAPDLPECNSTRFFRTECTPCKNNGTCQRVKDFYYNCFCNTTKSSDYFGQWCQVQKSRAAIIPAGRNTTDEEEDTLEVEAGREYTYYLIVLRHSIKSTTWYQVNVSDGSPTVHLVKSNFRSVSELRDEKVLEAVDRIKLDREPVYFTIKWIYKVGTYYFTFKLREYQKYTQPYKTHRLKIISKLPAGMTCDPTTTLKDVAHNTKNPIEYSRNEHFTVNAAIEDVCLVSFVNKGVQVHHEWKMYKLTQTFPAQGRENDWQLEDLVSEATGMVIDFPSLVLVEGLYWIQCRAYIVMNKIKYGNSDLGFFRIFYKPPKIHLHEGTLRVADPTREILLDASGSTDENFPEESEYLEYTWTCREHCNHGPWTGPIAEIPPNTFKNGETVRIYLQVQSRHAKNQASETIILHMLDHAALSVDCVRNCDAYNPGVEVVFQCHYTLNDKPGPASHLHWSWYPPLEIFPIPVKDEPYLVDVALPKVTDAEPREIICTAKPPGHEFQEFTSSLSIQINLPPHMGECTVTPGSGDFLVTTFNVDCERAQDVNAIVYSFYVRVTDGGDFTDDLQNELLLGHDTNPEIEDVFLPYGELLIIVRATDDLGLSSEVSIGPVSVKRPTSDEIKQLFADFIIKNGSVMRNKLLGGDLQAGLQLQIIALKMARDPKLLEEQIWSEEELDQLHTLAAVNLKKEEVIATFKEMEQVIHSMHMLTQVEDRTDVGNFTDVSRLLIDSAAQLAELIHRPNEDSPDHETDVLVNATSDAADRLLRACANFSSKPVMHQPMPPALANIRDVADYVNASDRDYFAGYRDDLKEFDEDGMDSVAVSAEPQVQKYSKVCHFILHSLQHATDAAVVQLGYNHTYERNLLGSAIIGKVFPRNSSEANLTITTSKGQVRLYIPKEDMQQIKNITNDMDIETQMIVIEVNPYVDDTSAQPTTSIVQVEVKDPDNHDPIIIKRTPVPLEIFMTFNKQIEKQTIEAGKSTNHKVAIIPPEAMSEFTFILSFKMNLPYNSKVEVQISDPSTPTMSFRILALKDRQPVFRDFCQFPTIETGDRGFSAVIETETIGLNEEPPEPYLEYFVGFLPFDPKTRFKYVTFSVVFTRPSCLHRNEDQKFWSEEGCMVKEVKKVKNRRPSRDQLTPSKLESITCLCNHLSTFAGTQFVIPHTIENTSVLSGFSIDEFSRNPVVLITVSILLFIYFLAFLICRYFDVLDEQKSTGLTIMADLKDSLLDTYYLITVLTGVSLWAGTSSCVCMVIYGSNGRSQIYTLKDKNLTVFRSGALDTFLVPCNKDLGTLEKIRIWTDHSGHDPAWYCRKILIRHVATDQSWHFYVNQWLEVSAVKGSTVILEIPATTKDEQTKFSTRFSENMLEQFDNAMLWVSIFRYSPASTFTRCQRLSCAFAVLSSYLMLDIMAQGTETTDADGLYDFGEYKIDLNSIIKSAQLVLFALPFGIIIIGLFKNILPRYVPTLIIWKNVIPATTELERKRFFIPSVHGFSYSKNKPGWPTKTVLFRQGDGEIDEEIGGEEESDDDYEDQAILEGANVGRPVRERLSPSSSSTFSVPSTDIPLLEGWIQERVRHDQEMDSGMETDDGEGDNEYDLFVQNLDVAVEDERKRDADNLTRLGRRAMTHAVREYDPNSFIFQGEYDVPGVEDLIDKRILEGRKRAKDGKEDSEQEEDPFLAGAITIQPPPKKKGKFRQLIDKLKKGKEAPPPWKEVVTNEYLEEIDKSLEKEMENRSLVQNKKNWEEQIALELCLLPQFQQPRFSWPWWFVYIAWFVCITSIIGTSGFTVIFGRHYGYLRSMRWLENFLGSIFMSKFVVQPLTAVAVALFATLLGKRHKIQERVQVLIEDSHNAAFLKSRKPYSFNIFRSFRTYGPLAGNQIFRLLIDARRRKELRGKLFRLTLCILLLAPLIAYSYSGHNSYNYGVTKNVRNMFQLNTFGERDGKIVFNNLHEMYQYVKSVLLSIHPEHPLDTKGHHRTATDRGGTIPHIAFIEDHQSVLIGVLRLRQQRIKPSECEADSEELGQQRSRHHQHHDCGRNKGFSASTQDRESYNPLWKPVLNGIRHPASATNDGWEFHGDEEGSKKIRSLSFTGHQGRYDGGGYIFDFGRTRKSSLDVMVYVNETNWLDHRTRALFIEFTLFNPNINKFVDIVLLIEQGPTWSYSMISWITPIELIPLEEFSHKSDEAVWLILSFILIVLVLIVITFVFFHDLCKGHKRRPLLSLNFWLDLTIIIFVTASVILSFANFFAAKEFSEVMDSDNEKAYVSIQRAAFWDKTQRAMFSLSQALVFVKTWKLLMFTDKTFLSFALTVKLTFGYMAAFVLMLVIMICAFALSGYFLFAEDLWEFSSWGEGMITLVDQILGVTLFDEFTAAKPFIGRVYSFSFGFFIVFVFLNFIVALLDLGVHEAKEVVMQRRVWLTFAQYFKRILYRTFPTLNRKYKKMKMAAGMRTLPPERVHAMKMVLVGQLRSFLEDSGYNRMQEMKAHSNKILAGTGFKVISKKEKGQRENMETARHMEQLKEITIAIFREKLGHEMKPEEFKEYADFNRAIVKLRVQKMDRKVAELEGKIDLFVDRIMAEIAKK